MMPEFIQRIFTLNYEYDDAFEHQRAQRLLNIVVAILVAAIVWTIFLSIPGLLQGKVTGTEVFPIITAFVLVGLYLLIQRGFSLLASRVFVALIFGVTVLSQINDVNTPQLIAVVLPVVLAGIILDVRSMRLVTVLVSLVILYGGLTAPQGSDLTFVTSAGLALIVVLCDLIITTFKVNTDDIAQASSGVVLQARRLNNYRIESDASNATRDIISNSIRFLRNELRFNYIRVVLLDDESGEAVQTFYSSIGLEQVAETTAFSIASNSAFQRAIDTVTPQIVTPRDPSNVANHLLPSSTSGVIIPAHSLNTTIALFDIQSEAPQPIEPETVAIIQTMVNQVAAQLVYQVTIDTLQNDIQEQQTVIEQQRQQMMRLQNQQSAGIVTDWENYLQLRGADTIGYDIDNKRQLSNVHIGDVPEALRPAYESGEIVVQTQGDEQVITVPIRLRDSVLGAMSFTVPQELLLTERKLEFIRSVTERLALALDNKRLLEQTRTQAERQSMANEIGSVLLSSTDVETVLQTAAERFNQALGAVATQIYLQPTTLKPIEQPTREDTV